MIPIEYRIKYKLNQAITIKPLFDSHVGNAYSDVKALKKYLADTPNGLKNTYLIGGGDLMDDVIVKDAKRYQKHVDATKSDAVVDEQIDMMEELLLPYKGRIIGLGTGNHEETINKYCATNPTRRLARRLDTVSLGIQWMVKLVLTWEGGGRGRTVVIRGHHGWGGGTRTMGGDLTKFEKDMNYWDADLFLYGHVHRRKIDSFDRIGLSGMKFVPKPKHLVVCGTFLKTFSLTDEATYSEMKGYPPVRIGGVDIDITPARQHVIIQPTMSEV